MVSLFVTQELSVLINDVTPVDPTLISMLIQQISKNSPMGDELIVRGPSKWGGGRIFESCDIFLENAPTLHAVSRVHYDLDR